MMLTLFVAGLGAIPADRARVEPATLKGHVMLHLGRCKGVGDALAKQHGTVSGNKASPTCIEKPSLKIADDVFATRADCKEEEETQEASGAGE